MGILLIQYKNALLQKKIEKKKSSGERARSMRDFGMNFMFVLICPYRIFSYQWYK